MKKIILLFIFLIPFLYAKQIIITTGEASGNYYKVGKKINEDLYQNKAKILKTSGSIENMLLVAQNKADIALVQADALSMLDIFYQIEGLNKYDLVDIAGYLYTEKLHILVNKDSKIQSISDLDNKTVSYGGKKSGSSITATFVEQQYNINFKESIDTSIENGLNLLSKNKIDALFYVTKTPSKLLSNYKNFRLLEAKEPIKANNDIKQEILKKGTYPFLEKDIKTYSVSTLLILKKRSSEFAKIQKYLKNKGIEPINNNTIKKNILDTGNILNVPKDVLDLYTKRYGNRALLRYNYLNKYLTLINKQTKITEKLKNVNLLVNKLYFLEDKVHWRKDNYWASPLEFIGTGAGDTEDFALLKLLFLTKLGIDNTKLKLIKKNTPLVVKNKIIRENYALAYFYNQNKPPIIFNYKNKERNIYLYKNNFKYEIVTKTSNKIWDKLFSSKLTNKDMDDILFTLKR